MLKLPAEVKIMEVGPRDGLQNEATLVPTKNKLDFIHDLVLAGIKRIEVTAFVSPRWILPLSDQMEVMLGLTKVPGVSYAALVPNVFGYERAIKCQVDEVSIVIAATDSHNLKNLNAHTKEVFARYQEVAKRALSDGCPFRAYLSCTFGCPYEGEVPLNRVVEMSKELLDLGAYEVALSDTIGISSPLKTLKVLEAVLKEIPKEKLALHMHDTRGMGLANIFAALSLGITSFDSSAGGLGGCPYAPGAAGNVATEDLLYMLHAMNIKTGIDIDKVSDASIRMEEVLQKQVPAKLVAIKRARVKISDY